MFSRELYGSHPLFLRGPRAIKNGYRSKSSSLTPKTPLRDMERIAKLAAINPGSPIAWHKEVSRIAFVHLFPFPAGATERREGRRRTLGQSAFLLRNVGTSKSLLSTIMPLYPR
jgi:hypothetical protein